MKNSQRLSIHATLITLLLLGGLGWMTHRAINQRREVHELRQRLATRTATSANLATPASSVPLERPSPELLRARGEVAQLIQQVARQTDPHSSGRDEKTDSGTADSELARLMKGRRPSEFPDFVPTSAVTFRGFDSPDHALESFWWHFSAPGRMSPDSITNLWWSPPTNAPTGFHYEIALGMGVGGLTGYRVTQREEISPHEVLFHLQREEGRSVVEELARFIRDGNRWVRKPTVKLVPDQP